MTTSNDQKWFEKGAIAPKFHLLYLPAPGLSNEKPDRPAHLQKIIFDDIGLIVLLPPRLSAQAYKK